MLVSKPLLPMNTNVHLSSDSISPVDHGITELGSKPLDPDEEEHLSPSSKYVLDSESDDDVQLPLTLTPPIGTSPCKTQASPDISPVHECITDISKMRFTVGVSPTDMIPEEPEYLSSDFSAPDLQNLSSGSDMEKSAEEHEFERIITVPTISTTSPSSGLEALVHSQPKALSPTIAAVTDEEEHADDMVRAQYLAFDNIAFDGREVIDIAELQEEIRSEIVAGITSSPSSDKPSSLNVDSAIRTQIFYHEMNQSIDVSSPEVKEISDSKYESATVSDTDLADSPAETDSASVETPDLQKASRQSSKLFRQVSEPHENIQRSYQTSVIDNIMETRESSARLEMSRHTASSSTFPPERAEDRRVRWGHPRHAPVISPRHMSLASPADDSIFYDEGIHRADTIDVATLNHADIYSFESHTHGQGDRNSTTDSSLPHHDEKEDSPTLSPTQPNLNVDTFSVVELESLTELREQEQPTLVQKNFEPPSESKSFEDVNISTADVVKPIAAVDNADRCVEAVRIAVSSAQDSRFAVSAGGANDGQEQEPRPSTDNSLRTTKDIDDGGHVGHVNRHSVEVITTMAPMSSISSEDMITSSSSEDAREPTLLAATYDLDLGHVSHVIATYDLSPDSVDKDLPGKERRIASLLTKTILSSPEDDVFEVSDQQDRKLTLSVKQIDEHIEDVDTDTSDTTESIPPTPVRPSSIESPDDNVEVAAHVASALTPTQDSEPCVDRPYAAGIDITPLSSIYGTHDAHDRSELAEETTSERSYSEEASSVIEQVPLSREDVGSLETLLNIEQESDEQSSLETSTTRLAHGATTLCNVEMPCGETEPHRQHFDDVPHIETFGEHELAGNDKYKPVPDLKSSQRSIVREVFAEDVADAQDAFDQLEIQGMMELQESQQARKSSIVQVSDHMVKSINPIFSEAVDDRSFEIDERELQGAYGGDTEPIAGIVYEPDEPEFDSDPEPELMHAVSEEHDESRDVDDLRPTSGGSAFSRPESDLRGSSGSRTDSQLRDLRSSDDDRFELTQDAADVDRPLSPIPDQVCAAYEDDGEKFSIDKCDIFESETLGIVENTMGGAKTRIEYRQSENMTDNFASSPLTSCQPKESSSGYEQETFGETYNTPFDKVEERDALVQQIDAVGSTSDLTAATASNENSKTATDDISVERIEHFIHVPSNQSIDHALTSELGGNKPGSNSEQYMSEFDMHDSDRKGEESDLNKDFDPFSDRSSEAPFHSYAETKFKSSSSSQSKQHAASIVGEFVVSDLENQKERLYHSTHEEEQNLTNTYVIVGNADWDRLDNSEQDTSLPSEMKLAYNVACDDHGKFSEPPSYEIVRHSQVLEKKSVETFSTEVIGEGQSGITSQFGVDYVAVGYIEDSYSEKSSSRHSSFEELSYSINAAIPSEEVNKPDNANDEDRISEVDALSENAPTERQGSNDTLSEAVMVVMSVEPEKGVVPECKPTDDEAVMVAISVEPDKGVDPECIPTDDEAVMVAVSVEPDKGVDPECVPTDDEALMVSMSVEPDKSVDPECVPTNDEPVVVAISFEPDKSVDPECIPTDDETVIVAMSVEPDKGVDPECIPTDDEAVMVSMSVEPDKSVDPECVPTDDEAVMVSMSVEPDKSVDPECVPTDDEAVMVAISVEPDKNVDPECILINDEVELVLERETADRIAADPGKIASSGELSKEDTVQVPKEDKDTMQVSVVLQAESVHPEFIPVETDIASKVVESSVVNGEQLSQLYHKTDSEPVTQLVTSTDSVSEHEEPLTTRSQSQLVVDRSSNGEEDVNESEVCDESKQQLRDVGIGVTRTSDASDNRAINGEEVDSDYERLDSTPVDFDEVEYGRPDSLQLNGDEIGKHSDNEINEVGDCYVERVEYHLEQRSSHVNVQPPPRYMTYVDQSTDEEIPSKTDESADELLTSESPETDEFNRHDHSGSNSGSGSDLPSTSKSPASGESRSGEESSDSSIEVIQHLQSLESRADLVLPVDLLRHGGSRNDVCPSDEEYEIFQLEMESIQEVTEEEDSSDDKDDGSQTSETRPASQIEVRKLPAIHDTHEDELEDAGFPEFDETSSVESFTTVVAAEQEESEEDDRMADVASISSSFHSDIYPHPELSIDVRSRQEEAYDSSSSSDKFEIFDQAEIEQSSRFVDSDENFEIILKDELEVAHGQTIPKPAEKTRSIPISSSPYVSADRFFSRSCDGDVSSVGSSQPSSLVEFERLERELEHKETHQQREMERLQSSYSASIDNFAVTSSLIEFERLEQRVEREYKKSLDPNHVASGSGESAVSSSLSSLAEFERLEREMEERGSGSSDSLHKNCRDIAGTSVSSVTSSLAEFERLEQSFLSDDFEIEAQRIVSMLESGELGSSSSLERASRSSDKSDSSRDLSKDLMEVSNVDFVEGVDPDCIPTLDDAIVDGREQLIDRSVVTGSQAPHGMDSLDAPEDYDVMQSSFMSTESSTWSQCTVISAEQARSEGGEEIDLIGLSLSEGFSEREGDLDSLEGETSVLVAGGLLFEKDIDADSLHGHDEIDSNSQETNERIMLASADSIELEKALNKSDDAMQSSPDSLQDVPVASKMEKSRDDYLQDNDFTSSAEKNDQMQKSIELDSLQQDLMGKSLDDDSLQEALMVHSTDSLKMEKSVDQESLQRSYEPDSLQQELFQGVDPIASQHAIMQRSADSLRLSSNSRDSSLQDIITRSDGSYPTDPMQRSADSLQIEHIMQQSSDSLQLEAAHSFSDEQCVPETMLASVDSLQIPDTDVMRTSVDSLDFEPQDIFEMDAQETFDTDSLAGDLTQLVDQEGLSASSISNTSTLRRDNVMEMSTESGAWSQSSGASHSTLVQSIDSNQDIMQMSFMSFESLPSDDKCSVQRRDVEITDQSIHRKTDSRYIEVNRSEVIDTEGNLAHTVDTDSDVTTIVKHKHKLSQLKFSKDGDTLTHKSHIDPPISPDSVSSQSTESSHSETCYCGPASSTSSSKPDVSASQRDYNEPAHHYQGADGHGDSTQ